MAEQIKDLNNEIFDISQPKNGYRFSMDALMLASEVKVLGNERIIEIGCGSGIISIILAHKYPELKITGIEIQEELFTIAMKNVIANGLESRINIIHEDIKNIRIDKKEDLADIIVTNPPFGKKNSGRISPNPQKAIAKHEIALDLDTLLNCSERLLKDTGRLFIIFPFNRVKELENSLKYYNFNTEYIRHIHIKTHKEPLRIIACAVKI